MRNFKINSRFFCNDVPTSTACKFLKISELLESADSRELVIEREKKKKVGKVNLWLFYNGKFDTNKRNYAYEEKGKWRNEGEFMVSRGKAIKIVVQIVKFEKGKKNSYASLRLVFFFYLPHLSLQN